MKYDDFLFKLVELESKNNFISPFYCVVGENEQFVLNSHIFPNDIFDENKNIFDILKENENKISHNDMETFNIFYKNVFIEKNISHYENNLPIELYFEFNYTENDTFNYKILVNSINLNSKNNIEISGYIYKGIKNKKYLTDNRYSDFNNYIKELLKNRNLNKNYAIIQVDIEKFKIINDIYGEEFGDYVLEHISKCFKTLFLKEPDAFLRLSNDVFVFLVDFDTKEQLINRIQFWDNKLSYIRKVKIKLNWGVNIIYNYDTPARVLIDETTIARQSIKGNTLNNIGFYNESQKEKLKKRKDIEDKMYQALEMKQFKVYIQPKYDMEKNRIVGGEVLTRWIDENDNIITPDEFIGIFEENGFIIKLDKYIWEETCKLLNKWKREKIPIVPISINISRRHFDNFEFIDFLEYLIKKYDIDKKWLELEITESVDNINSSKSFEKLKENGFVLLMDDFGSGYSSLNTLKNTNFDVIKLDKGFLSKFMTNPRGKKIIQHTLAMIKDIKLGIIAEGVETKEEELFLTNNGCHVAQGFLYSKPKTAQQFENLIKNNLMERVI